MRQSTARSEGERRYVVGISGNCWEYLRRVLEPPRNTQNHPYRPQTVAADSETNSRPELSSNREIHLSILGSPPDPVSIFMAHHYSVAMAQLIIEEPFHFENVCLPLDSDALPQQGDFRNIMDPA